MTNSNIQFPPVKSVGSPFANRLRGYFHRVLLPVSRLYCRWKGLGQPVDIYPLPFNLILKCTPRTLEQEAMAIVAARNIGIPVPKMIQYGDHRSFGSILMSRIPGVMLSEACNSESLSPTQVETIGQELAMYLDLMRNYKSPMGSRVCSLNGGPLFSPFLPADRVGPCDDEDAFHATFLEYALPDFWTVRGIRFEDNLTIAKDFVAMTHPIVFTHGDLMPWNIMVHNGHISGIIDWECAGWFPDYYEYTYMVKIDVPDSWWNKLVKSMPSYRFERELQGYRAWLTFAANSFSR
ncbi:hypothetical protein HYDPIDRAFT_118718 [Hydnomerulius pinastri MD-312]|uniref:Aminoglycoside phosphotransferase domain-containing protein n=1 Tax=Hydnomerulius pinastri MD-312 TaxID=994086 RepID=A0A0C9W918_9AGAM|nr:hypothetical protein HYDPIDRAFT_118718 [Hydnomerulius pinastri MD-312]